MVERNEEFMATKDKRIPEGANLTMTAVGAARERWHWVRQNWKTPTQPKSWRIVMEFDDQGDLLKYWETSLDDAGKELIDGGFSRVCNQTRSGTIMRNGVRLSPAQINALLAGLEHKMSRSALGWLCHINGPNEPALLIRMVTIRSLHRRGLVDANFTDMRVHDGDCTGVRALDGAVYEHSLASPKQPKFQVWTNQFGKEVLKQLGFFEKPKLKYH
jgi:hypothetical protein